MALLKLTAPWRIYYKELCALFEKDEEVHIVYDEDNQLINLYVENEAKAEAMTTVLPVTIEYGNVELKINIIPADRCNFRRSNGELMSDLFYGNPILNNIIIYDGIFTNPITYVIFENKVVQYYNDDIGDVNGICSTLYQDIAKRVFNDLDGIYYCTAYKK